MPSIRIASYNISGGIMEDKRFYSKRGNSECSARLARAKLTMEGVATLLAEAEIDIVALQEVDTCYSGAQTLDQANYLAQRLSAQVASLPLFEYHLGRHTNVRTGLATLSKSTLLSHSPLPFAQQRVPWKRRLKAKLLGAKGALHTVHEVEGERLHIVNAHLTHDIAAQKEFELETLLAYCSHLDPVVLLGDLNTTPLPTRSPAMVEGHYFGHDRCMQILAAYMREHPRTMHVDARLGAFVGRGEGMQGICTYPAGKESIKLDYCIGFSSKESFALSPECILSAPLSNHAATSALLSW